MCPGWVRVRTSDSYAPVSSLGHEVMLWAEGGNNVIASIKKRDKCSENGFHGILIRAGTLGNERDVVVSSRQKILFEGWPLELHFGELRALVPVQSLVNNYNILIHTEPTDWYSVAPKTLSAIFVEGIPFEAGGKVSGSLSVPPDGLGKLVTGETLVLDDDEAVLMQGMLFPSLENRSLRRRVF